MTGLLIAVRVPVEVRVGSLVIERVKDAGTELLEPDHGAGESESEGEDGDWTVCDALH
jgi:hypothetical protein